MKNRRSEGGSKGNRVKKIKNLINLRVNNGKKTQTEIQNKITE